MSVYRKLRVAAHKALVFLIGLMMALLLVELALFIVGRVYTSEPQITNTLQEPGKLSQADLIIACFGDSHTFGVGASSKSKTYPSQLERILSTQFPELKIRVVNHGEPGTNSSQHVKFMKWYLPLYPRPPDVVFVLSFGANDWNLTDCSAIVQGYARLPLSKHLYRNLERTRIGKLAILLKLNWTNRGFTSKLARIDYRVQGKRVQTLLDCQQKDDRAFLAAWIAHDLHEMRTSIESAGSRPLFGLYAYDPTDMNGIIRDALAKERVAFCEPSANGARWPELQLWDTQTLHPNDRGYEQKAREIAACLRDYGLVPPVVRAKHNAFSTTKPKN